MRASPLLGASTFLLLAACGQTGALYLPEDSGPVVIRESGESAAAQGSATPRSAAESGTSRAPPPKR